MMAPRPETKDPTGPTPAPDGPSPLRLKLIVCKVLQREAYCCAARARHVVDVHLMHQGLHNEPDRLRRQVGQALCQTTDVQGRRYDAFLLGYGLCSNGIVGLTAELPIVVPRAHDCVTLLLGSKDRYQQYFDTHRGVYWYSPGWIETNTQPGKERFEAALVEYTHKYGPDNARYLMDVQETWVRQYAWATYIDWPWPGSQAYKDYTRRCAEYLGWTYDELPGDPGLLQRMLDGPWRPEEFLVVEPGWRIASDVTTPGIIKAEPTEQTALAPEQRPWNS